MKSTVKVKLSLARESLRRLNGPQLGGVAGGLLTRINDCSTQFSKKYFSHCECSVVDTCYTANGDCEPS